MTHSRKSVLLLCALLMSSCSVGPDYQRPDVTTPEAYKEAGKWSKAQPADDQPRGEWWTIYNDPILNDLEKQVAISNQNLKASEAAYRQALAAVQEARASFFPTLDADTSAARTHRGSSGTNSIVSNSGNIISGSSNGSKQNTNQFNANLSANWEIDLWGRIGRTVENQKALAEASAADLASATLSIQSTLAIDYFELSAVDQLKKLLEETIKADTRSLEIAENQYKVGIVSKGDVAQAQAQVEAVRSQLVNTDIQRAQLEHAIAVLIGKSPAEFTLANTKDLPEPPVIPVGVPSTLLQRRPDIAVAERQVAAANAQIGIEEAAYYPDLSLSASAGIASSTFGNLLKTSNAVWSIGPDLALTLFDGGARSARIKAAEAGYDQQVALYRQAVLTAFQQVEDSLTSVRVLEQQADIQTKVVAAAAESSRIIQNQYNAGLVVFTNVVTVQNTELADKQTALTIRQNRLVSSIQLVTALGGGWNNGQEMPQAVTPLENDKK